MAPRKKTSKKTSKKATSRARGRKKADVTVDMAGVEGRVLLPEGDYHSKVAEITVEDGDAAEYLKWKFLTIDDDTKLNNKPLFYNTSLSPQSLWNLRNLLETLGVEIPDGPLDLNFDELIDLELVLITSHEEYDGKDKTRVTDFMPVGDIDKDAGDDESEVEVEKDDEEDEGKDADDDLPEVTEDEIGDMDVEELEELIEKYDLEVNLKKLKTARKKVSAVVDAMDEAGYLAEDD